MGRFLACIAILAFLFYVHQTFFGSEHIEIEDHASTYSEPVKVSLPPPQKTSSKPQQSIDLNKAYKLTNVERTPFKSSGSDDDEYLKALFNVTDMIVIERVKNQISFNQKHKTEGLSGYDTAIANFRTINKPESPELLKVHELVSSAATIQRAYFAKLDNEDGGSFDVNAPEVQKSHNQLLEAYSILMAKYEKNKKNHRAFYAHLCAMDFI